MHLDFTGQTVLITGGTRGIGAAMAAQFAAAGATVILTGRDVAAIAELRAAAPANRRYEAVDLAQASDTDRFCALIESWPKLDVLINNAGINKINPIDRTELADWEALRTVNLDGAYKVLRACSRVMKRQRSGRIVNIGSIFGVISKAQRSLYTMTKFAVRGLTVASAIDLAPDGILVNTLSPGFIRTDLTAKVLGENGMREMAAQVPLGRLGEPEEIAKVALFLASRHNTYLTGQNIIVDGGFVDV